MKQAIYKLFFGRTDNTWVQFFRYCFVGGIATAADWGASYLLFHFAFRDRFAVTANVLSFLIGLAVNYLLSTRWIFKRVNGKSRVKEFLEFAAVGLVGMLLTVGITKLFAYLLSYRTAAYQIIGKMVSTAAAFLWNFFARKYLVFSVRMR